MNRLYDFANKPGVLQVAVILCLMVIFSSGVSGTFSRHLVRILIPLAGIIYFFSDGMRARMRSFNVLWWIVMAFMATIILSASNNGDWAKLLDYPAFRFSYDILLLFVVPVLLREGKQFRIAVGLVLVVLLLNDIKIYYDFFHGVMRPVGFIKGVQETPMMYIILLSMIMVLMFQGKVKTKVEKSIFSISLILGCLAVFITGSRAAMVALLCVAIWLLAIYHHQVKWKKILAVGLVSLCLIAAFSNSMKYHIGRVESFTRLESDKGWMARIYAWEAATKMIIEHPIRGIGLQKFGEVYEEGYNERQLEKQYVLLHAHNIFFQMWAENGLLAFLAFGVLLIYLFRWSWKNRYNPAGMSLFMALLGMLIYAQTEYPLRYENIMRLFCLFIGACFAANLYIEKQCSYDMNEK